MTIKIGFASSKLSNSQVLLRLVNALSATFLVKLKMKAYSLLHTDYRNIEFYKHFLSLKGKMRTNAHLISPSLKTKFQSCAAAAVGYRLIHFIERMMV